MYNTIKELQPYFFSLRAVGEDVSLDIKLPKKWIYNNIVSQFNGLKILQQKGDDNFNLISLVSRGDEEGYNLIVSCAKRVIEVNKEEEQKQELFSNLVTKLKELFENESLDKIKEISLFKNVNTSNNEGIGLAIEGSEEGREGDSSSQSQNDSRNIVN